MRPMKVNLQRKNPSHKIFQVCEYYWESASSKTAAMTIYEPQRQKKYLLLQKHAYSNIKNISPPKIESFQIKKKWYFSFFIMKIYIVDAR